MPVVNLLGSRIAGWRVALTSGEEWLGLELGEALVKARPFRVLLTRPGYRCLGKGRLLVVGQRQESQGLTLVLTYTEFERLPKENNA